MGDGGKKNVQKFEVGPSGDNVIFARFVENSQLILGDLELPLAEETTIPDVDVGEEIALEEDEVLTSDETSEGNIAVIAELLDFSVVIDLESRSRRRLGDSAMVQHLYQELKTLVEQQLMEEMIYVISGGATDYALPSGVILKQESGKAANGERYEAVFGGIAAFKNEEGDNISRLPSAETTRSIQSEALMTLGEKIMNEINRSRPDSTYHAASVVTAIVADTLPEQGIDSKASDPSDNSIAVWMAVLFFCIVVIIILVVLLMRRRGRWKSFPNDREYIDSTGHVVDKKSINKYSCNAIDVIDTDSDNSPSKSQSSSSSSAFSESNHVSDGVHLTRDCDSENNFHGTKKAGTLMTGSFSPDYVSECLSLYSSDACDTNTDQSQKGDLECGDDIVCETVERTTEESTEAKHIHDTDEENSVSNVRHTSLLASLAFETESIVSGISQALIGLPINEAENSAANAEAWAEAEAEVGAEVEAGAEVTQEKEEPRCPQGQTDSKAQTSKEIHEPDAIDSVCPSRGRNAHPVSLLASLAFDAETAVGNSSVIAESEAETSDARDGDGEVR